MDRCALCPGINTCVQPDGPEDATELFIGEAPGKDENHYKNSRGVTVGRPFVGKTGEEVNRHYLPLAALRRDSVRFTNAIRCLPTSAGGKLDPNSRKDRALLESCANRHLYPDIERGRYRLLVPLGSFATRAILPDVDLELQHGIPVESPWGVQAFPMYHPALGIHSPKQMLYIRTDWQRLRRYLKGELAIREDAYPNPDYREVTDAREIQQLNPSLPLAADTESDRQAQPFCLTYSQSAGLGRLIRADRHDLLRALQARLDRWNAPILFHNWVYDWAVVEKMDLRFPAHHIVDTMARVFHLGNLPQGLKALAFRELGMQMQDFLDVVTPHSQRLVLDYYRNAQLVDWPKPPKQQVIGDYGALEDYQPQSMSTKFKRFFTDFSKNPEKDVFQMWEKNWVEEQSAIEAECGPWPGLCITHVPFDTVLHYACRDADALIRLWPILVAMRRVMRRVPQERWRDYAA